MNSMVNSLAVINERTYVDVAGSFFNVGIPEPEWREFSPLQDILSPGNLYGGFRAMPLAFARSQTYRTAAKILLIRDPRDALVSEYFSVAHTHSLPKVADGVAAGVREELLGYRKAAQSSAINDFVLTRAVSMNRTIMEYAETASDTRTKVFRYEDVILSKRSWLAAMAAHFGWDGGSKSFIDGMMGWADKVPAVENPMEFVRKVLPGDHKDKLSLATIERLNEVMAPTMNLFGYQ